jgi:hypothetical protein
MIFGIGTGRCGTQSLAYLLNQQKGHKVSHEFLARNTEHGPLPWTYNEELIDENIQTLVDQGFTGDMKRNKDKVVHSFIRKTAGLDHWGTSIKVNNIWDKAFPSYGLPNKSVTIGMYYDEYYLRVDSLIEKYPENIKIFPIETLNQPSGVKSVLDFCGIPKESQVLETKVVGSKIDGSDWYLTSHE